MMLKKSQEKLLAFGFAIFFLLFLLIVALGVPNPSPWQFWLFNVVLALSAAGFVSMVPGFMVVEVPKYVRAGGAMAAFAIVFFFKPAAFVTSAWISIPADPDNYNAPIITATSHDNSSIEATEYQVSSREFRVIFKKGYTDGWFEALHTKMSPPEMFYVRYELKSLKLVRHPRRNLELKI